MEGLHVSGNPKKSGRRVNSRLPRPSPGRQVFQKVFLTIPLSTPQILLPTLFHSLLLYPLITYHGNLSIEHVHIHLTALDIFVLSHSDEGPARWDFRWSHEHKGKLSSQEKGLGCAGTW